MTNPSTPPHSPRAPELVGLLEAMARGEQSALAGLYDATKSLVYGIAYRILGETQSADEVTLDVYMTAWRRAASYAADRGTPKAWLLTIARSRAIDAVRARRSQRDAHEVTDQILEIADPAQGPRERGEREERRENVRAALASLSDVQRETVSLAFLSGFTHQEIAAQLGEPLGTIKTRIRLGLQKLRESLRSPDGK